MKEKQYWEGKHFSFTQNKECEFFPCHSGADTDNFNCLFCYCPLYALGTKCGGNYKILENGIKDCSSCLVPHGRNSYGYVAGRFSEIAEVVSRNILKEQSKTGADSGTGAGADSGTEAGADSGTETGADSGTGAGADSGTETGADSGTGAGAGSCKETDPASCKKTDAGSRT